MLPDGRRQIVGFALPGELPYVTFPEFPSRCLLKINYLLRRMNELMVRELSQAQDHMVLLGRRSAEEKVASFVLAWRDRLARLGATTTTLPLPMGRQDIADFLGLTIETVSRTFTKLERDGLIEITPGGVRLTDSERVAALAAA
jgi:CRP/FNR family transcriptional regulator, anaerobic regulatory protein